MLLYRYSLSSVNVLIRRKKVINHLGVLEGVSILDVGSGKRSWLASHGLNVTSLDKRISEDIDIVADARFLPFKNEAFDSVVSVDLIEHIPKGLDRNLSLAEMIRVAKKRVIVHCPLEDGVKFFGRRYDRLLQSYMDKLTGNIQKGSTWEHINSGHPSTTELTNFGFNIRGSLNVYVWLFCLLVTYSLPIIGLLISRVLYFCIFRWFSNKEPYYSGVALLHKKSKKSEALV